MGFSEDRAKGQFGPLHFLVAENPYILWEATEHWKTVWREGRADAEIVSDTVDGANLNLDRLTDLVTALPMFTAIQLVVIRGADRIPQNRREEFVSILRRRSDAAKILLTASSVDKRLKWYKALSGFVPIEEFPRIYENKLSGWARRIAGDFDWSLSPQAAEMLAEVHGMDLFEMRQTIERAVLFVGKRRRLEVADIAAVAAGEGAHNIFRLFDAIKQRQLADALKIVRALFASGDQSPFWLGAMSTHYQRLFPALEWPPGRSKFDAARAMGVSPYIAEKMQEEAGIYKETGLDGAMRAVFETDWVVKTSTMPSRMAFELLIYRLCTRPRLVGESWFRLETPNTRE